VARNAASLQRKQALLQARRQMFQARQALSASSRKKKLDADKALTEAEKGLTRAEAAMKQPPTTAYTPRPATYPQAAIAYGKVESRPYPRISSGRRLALANWIADRDNPLTARVAMNHVWLRHFGSPPVPSVFDFGRNGQKPTHRALLDWLAAEFMNPSPQPLSPGEGRGAGVRGWSMKHMHRLIVTSAAYRMDVLSDPANAGRDPDNRYLWRADSPRIEAAA